MCYIYIYIPHCFIFICRCICIVVLYLPCNTCNTVAILVQYSCKAICNDHFQQFRSSAHSVHFICKIHGASDVSLWIRATHQTHRVFCRSESDAGSLWSETLSLLQAAILMQYSGEAICNVSACNALHLLWFCPLRWAKPQKNRCWWWFLLLIANSYDTCNELLTQLIWTNFMGWY